ncbi:MAG: hypothetical protein V4618_13545 [Pseudomonadota bacterium]
MIPLPLLAGGAAIALAAGFLGGWTVRDWKADAAQTQAFDTLLSTKDRMQGKVDAKADQFETLRQSIEPQRAEVRNTIREVYRDVPVPADCALRPDALRVLENARQRANASTAGQSDEPMPATARPDPVAGS